MNKIERYLAGKKDHELARMLTWILESATHEERTMKISSIYACVEEYSKMYPEAW